MARIKKIVPGTKVEKGQAVKDPSGRIGRVTGVERTGFKHKDGSRTPATVVTTEDAKGNETRQITTDASRWGIFGR